MRQLSSRQISLYILLAGLLAYTVFIQVYIEQESLRPYHYRELKVARQHATDFVLPGNEQFVHQAAVRHSFWKYNNKHDAHHQQQQQTQQQHALIPVRTIQKSEYATNNVPNLTKVQSINKIRSHFWNITRPNIYNDPWLETRLENGRIESWYANGTTMLKENADAEGPLLDFIIAGWPKCGTTTLQANLARYAPMPASSDICTPIHKTVWYAYQTWPLKFDNNNNVTNATSAANTTTTNTTNSAIKLLRGTKCPRHVHDLQVISKHLPRTKIIMGIRHPVLWFSSFWNMLAHNDRKYLHRSPYDKIIPCQKANCCKDGCPKGNLFCIHRAQFHLGLASMGKTNLTWEERQWLSPQTFCGGHMFAPGSANQQRPIMVKNPVFLYDQTQLSEDYAWESLADFLQLPDGTIAHDKYQSSHGRKAAWSPKAEIDICQTPYDELRQLLMPIAYELSVWLTDYFIPVVEDTNRHDVVIPNVRRFREIVQGYRQDPCGRLIRNEDTGTYELGNAF